MKGQKMHTKIIIVFALIYTLSNSLRSWRF